MKFVVSGHGHQEFQRTVLPNLKSLLQVTGDIKVDYQQKQLTNYYFDTSDFYFAEHRFGFRVRGCNNQFEQTLKTQGTTTGGLHQRGEYNIEIPNSTPDLRLFDSVVWPKDRLPQDLNEDLQQRFATNFTRDEYSIIFDEQHFEIVFDHGEVIADGDTVPIHEIEIELKSGDVANVFTLARILNQYLSLRLSDTTKAAAGYTLIGESLLQKRKLPKYLALNQNCSTEDAFCIAVERAMAHWQFHEQAYMQTHTLKYLDLMYEGLQLLLQSVALYLPVLQCVSLLKLHRLLISYTQKWQWLNELHNIRYLRSKKGPFSKHLNQHDALMSYLQGRKIGLLQGRSPDQLFFDSEANDIKILTSEILIERPWRDAVTGADKPVLEHARGWLSQSWQNVMQSLSQAEILSHTHYVATETILRQALTNGFLLAELFAEKRGQFRAPWLDILVGVEELKALITLKQLLRDAEFSEDPELKSWTADKISNLLHVIERTRKVAIRLEAYW